MDRAMREGGGRIEAQEIDRCSGRICAEPIRAPGRKLHRQTRQQNSVAAPQGNLASWLRTKPGHQQVRVRRERISNRRVLKGCKGGADRIALNTVRLET